uniref:Uncharacterized protein n=1 Tax=Anguilla anguilla TaxID=7936 RepID=A0A0E9U1H4_ANGAN
MGSWKHMAGLLLSDPWTFHPYQSKYSLGAFQIDLQRP